MENNLLSNILHPPYVQSEHKKEQIIIYSKIKIIGYPSSFHPPLSTMITTTTIRTIIKLMTTPIVRCHPHFNRLSVHTITHKFTTIKRIQIKKNDYDDGSSLQSTNTDPQDFFQK